MSSSILPSELVLEYETSRLSSYIWTAATVLCIYEYTLTFLTMEVPFVWLKPWNLTSLVYLIGRYAFLFEFLGQGAIYLVPGRSQSFCHSFMYAPYTAQFIETLCTHCLFALRVYALYQQKTSIIVVLGVIIVAGRAQFIASLSMLTGVASTSVIESGIPSSGSICGENIPSNTLLLIFTRLQTTIVLSLLIFDAVIFGLTVRKTYRHVRDMRRLRQLSIVQVVLRDGALYFLFSLLLGITVTTTQVYSMSSTNPARGLGTRFFLLLTPLYNVLPNILVSRLYLNLKSFNNAPHPAEADHENKRPLSGIRFAGSRVLGNIGGPLRTAVDDEDIDLGIIDDMDDPASLTRNTVDVEMRAGEVRVEGGDAIHSFTSEEGRPNDIDLRAVA
ncbi:uncharacterized protein STEHIDRAFT_171387 [Stereum hirsutum FP-91666 SS1]|uniref:uncharacterized protein n=1 Tax=Stereum hirsutum (strain FP-91666) TaxID=721885 RepID=UPI0004449D10|nr:uncharacterized protein STEHIDRAFT_171387 [Stereum hirsutum FP-91666 SS1]EIM82486.1 hypothetical protein STEHIDRAFT_171387 [Stereum hirsutum FP-91666 SS1]